MDGDSLPVSAFVANANGEWEQGASAYEKRGLSLIHIFGPAALAVLSHGQDGGVLTADADTHDLVALGQLDGAPAVAAAAHGTGILLIRCV